MPLEVYYGMRSSLGVESGIIRLEDIGFPTFFWRPMPRKFREKTSMYKEKHYSTLNMDLPLTILSFLTSTPTFFSNQIVHSLT